MKPALAFYTQVLDFTMAEPNQDQHDPGYAALLRDGAELHLSSHGGDGVFGQAVAVIIADADALFAKFKKRGLDNSHKPRSPVHQGPTPQSWGTREFYVDDPDGYTIRFIERGA
jgi:catechol 2,3-dioxygenase-like lactoylglutathione lyase family enzyme